MPVLPLSHPEPFAATLGVMLYPGTDDADARKAKAFAAHYLAVPMQRYIAAGHKPSLETSLQLMTDGGDRARSIRRVRDDPHRGAAHRQTGKGDGT